MDKFMSDLAPLIITVIILGAATVLIMTGHASLTDLIPLISIPITYWFMGKAFAWMPPTPSPPAPQPPSTEPQPLVLPQNRASGQ